ncbi:MAG: hypothetical protein COV45_09355 [Deltaproteobacteria bacterium CG11_big_fil_rev_8_21_14_0_20_47_16]|nr:MAG: hypothetical protein COV45_09355 [Deltaproteobacteria bacterium CG11_big_fil_rev_8_21_14_0_20_47_16]
MTVVCRKQYTPLGQNGEGPGFSMGVSSAFGRDVLYYGENYSESVSGNSGQLEANLTLLWGDRCGAHDYRGVRIGIGRDEANFTTSIDSQKVSIQKTGTRIPIVATRSIAMNKHLAFELSGGYLFTVGTMSLGAQLQVEEIQLKIDRESAYQTHGLIANLGLGYYAGPIEIKLMVHGAMSIHILDVSSDAPDAITSLNFLRTVNGNLSVAYRF